MWSDLFPFVYIDRHRKEIARRDAEILRLKHAVIKLENQIGALSVDQMVFNNATLRVVFSMASAMNKIPVVDPRSGCIECIIRNIKVDDKIT